MLYSASWVVPVTRPPLAEGRVAIEDGRVTWVGQAGEPGEPGGPVHDLGPGVILPGLVNAHCHRALSPLGGLADRAPAGFVPWVESLMSVRGRGGRAGVARAPARRG